MAPVKNLSVCLIVILVAAWSCKDNDAPVQPELEHLSVSVTPDSMVLGEGSRAFAIITGGSGSYALSVVPSDTIASARIAGDTLFVWGHAEGQTSLVICDSTDSTLTADVQIMIGPSYGWQSLGEGVNNRVRAILVEGNSVFVGGDFTTAGGVSAQRIAMWNGVEWQSVGGGVNGVVYCMEMFQGLLYVGGYFTQAGGVSSAGVASWDGSSWNSPGGGVSGAIERVFSLKAIDGYLYAGGDFDSAGGEQAGSIARWDGVNWSSVAGSFPYGNQFRMTARAISQGYPFIRVAGRRNDAVSFYPFIVQTDGVSWDHIGDFGISQGAVGTMTLFGGDTYLGGSFPGLEGLASRGILRFNGSFWSSLEGGVNGSVSALLDWDSLLVVGGGFGMAGSVSARNLATWNGSTWDSLTNDLGGDVSALGSTGGALYVGGSFSSAGAVNANNIAVWRGRP